MTESQTLEAIYENGILRPLKMLTGLPEHTKVKIIVEYEVVNPLLQFAGILSDEEAEAIQAVIAEEFGKVDLDEW